MMYRDGQIELQRRVSFKTMLPMQFHDVRYAAGQVIEMLERDARVLADRGLGEILAPKTS